MKWFNTICNAIGDGFIDIGREVDYHKPAIFVGLGVIGMGLTIVSAVKRSRKLDDILDESENRKYNIETIDSYIEQYGRENTADVYAAEYGEDKRKLVMTFDKKHELLNDKITVAVDTVKLFAPTGALFAVSSLSILYGYKVLSGRFAGAVAAFNGVSEAFRAYRERVQKEQGSNWDTYYMTGQNKPVPEVEITDEEFLEPKPGDLVEGEMDEDRLIEADELVNCMPESGLPNQYCFYFGPNSPLWTGNPAIDMLTLRGRQSIFTDRLIAKGAVVLNEVLDHLELGITPGGAVTGWIKGNGDNKVDFGLDKIEMDPSRTIWCKDDKAVYILEFNVDGVIYDKLNRVK